MGRPMARAAHVADFACGFMRLRIAPFDWQILEDPSHPKNNISLRVLQKYSEAIRAYGAGATIITKEYMHVSR